MRFNEIKEQPKDQGTFVGVHFNIKTKNLLKTFIEQNNIPNSIDYNILHSTIIYSDKSFEWNITPINETINPNTYEWAILSGALVLKFQNSTLNNRHNQAIKAGGVHGFDHYMPHVTLSYDVVNFDISKLPLPEFPLVINSEYTEVANDDWVQENLNEYVVSDLDDTRIKHNFNKFWIHKSGKIIFLDLDYYDFDHHSQLINKLPKLFGITFDKINGDSDHIYNQDIIDTVIKNDWVRVSINVMTQEANFEGNLKAIRIALKMVNNKYTINTIYIESEELPTGGAGLDLEEIEKFIKFGTLPMGILESKLLEYKYADSNLTFDISIENKEMNYWYNARTNDTFKITENFEHSDFLANNLEELGLLTKIADKTNLWDHKRSYFFKLAFDADWVRVKLYQTKYGQIELTLQSSKMRNIVKAARFFFKQNNSIDIIEFETNPENASNYDLYTKLEGRRMEMFLKTGGIPSQMVRESPIQESGKDFWFNPQTKKEIPIDDEHFTYIMKNPSLFGVSAKKASKITNMVDMNNLALRQGWVRIKIWKNKLILQGVGLKLIHLAAISYVKKYPEIQELELETTLKNFRTSDDYWNLDGKRMDIFLKTGRIVRTIEE